MTKPSRRTPSGIDGSSNSGDRFGWSLASGNWNGDGVERPRDRRPFETVHDRREEGVVFSILGTSGTGLQTTRSQIMSQDTIFNTAEGHAGEHFGSRSPPATSTRRSPRRTFDDLAIGVPGDLPSNSGAVNIVYGTEHSFELVGEKFFQGKSAGRGGILGSKESGDEFGAVLTAADINADGAADLAIGVPGEDVDSANGVGGVHVIFSNGTELDPAFGPNILTQDTSRRPGHERIGRHDRSCDRCDRTSTATVRSSSSWGAPARTSDAQRTPVRRSCSSSLGRTAADGACSRRTRRASPETSSPTIASVSPRASPDVLSRRLRP